MVIIAKISSNIRHVVIHHIVIVIYLVFYMYLSKFVFFWVMSPTFVTDLKFRLVIMEIDLRVFTLRKQT